MNALAELPAALFEAGIFADMPAEEYHKREAMSASGIKKMLQSPQHYMLMRTRPSEPTDAMQFGSAVHCGALEPDRFASAVLCPPADAPKKPTAAQWNAKKPSPETLDAIAFWQAFNRECIGRIVLTRDDHARAQRCIDAVRAHPAAAALLEGAEREVSLFWNDARYGVPCKSREDIYSHGGITDLKTTTDASPEGFGKQIANLLYHVQGAHYISGSEHVRNESPRFFAFIAVESEEPHAVAVYALPGNAILAGAHLANRALERYAAALANGQWSGYPDTIELIKLPAWALRFD